MKAMPWFRFYHEAIDDEKLRLLAFEDRWHFVALLCLKARGLIDDEAPTKRRKICVKMGLDSMELDKVAFRLAEVGLIDATTLQPLAWDERQFISDNSTARVQRYRDKLKQKGNVSVAAQDTDTDTDSDKEGNKYPAAFEAVWQEYPRRPGANKAGTFKAFTARIKANAKLEDMIEGMRRYAAYLEAMGTEPQYIKQPETFFGPAEHYLSDWTPPRSTPRGNRQDQRSAVMAGLEETGEKDARRPSDIDV